MKDGRALMLANAGLIAGLALGSIVIAAGSASPALTASPGSARTIAAGTAEPPETMSGEATAESRQGARRLPDLVATLTGMDARDVDWQWRAGQSLVAIARAKGVTGERLVSAALEDFSRGLDEDVSSGRITSDQRARVIAAARVTLEREVTARTPAECRLGRVA